MFFVAWRIVLDCLVLQFSYNDKSQINMEYDEDTIVFMAQNPASIRQSSFYTVYVCHLSCIK
jgi:hypothetical protein